MDSRRASTIDAQLAAASEQPGEYVGQRTDTIGDRAYLPYLKRKVAPFVVAGLGFAVPGAAQI